MDSIGSLSTSLSLIAQAKRGEADAWNTVADLYGPLVYRWARQAGLQDSDAADLMQDVFADVAQGIAGFRNEKPQDTFRGWLWTIAHNRLRRFFRMLNSRPAAIGGSDANQFLQALPDDIESVGEPDDGESTTDLIHRAIEMIRSDFADHTWQAFWRLAISGHAAAEIGHDLQMNERAVRQAKYRVLCRLRQILGDD
jgi:RNA polymerase sigma-70 factor (ECF subfamily)